MSCTERSNVLVVFLVVFIIGYLCLGALTFSFIHAPIEEEIKRDLLSLRTSFLLSHPGLTVEDLDTFLTQVLEASDRGVTIVANKTSLPNWDFGQSFFFAGTIISTLGYGHVKPLSEVTGKLFCVAYALIGVPMMFILISALTQRLMILINILQEKLMEKMEHTLSVLSIRLIHLSIILVIILSLIIFIPAAVFYSIEVDWDYLDAFYYCVISMTTVGLGDFIPGELSGVEHRGIYKITVTFYLLMGLVLAITAVSTICAIPEFNLDRFFYVKKETQPKSDKEQLHLNSPEQDSYQRE